MVRNARTFLVIALMGLGSSATAQSYTQLQWGINKGVSPYNIGINLSGTWYDVATISSSGVLVPATMASFTCSTHQWLSSVTALGVPQCTQPAFSDLSGQIDASQLIAPTALTLGAVKSSSAGSNQFATGIDTAGVVTYAQPAFSNLSGSIDASQLIAPGATTFGAVKSSSAPSNQFATGINTSGSVTYAQPAFSNLSGQIAASQLIAPTLTTLGGVKAIADVPSQWLKSLGTDGVFATQQPEGPDILHGAVTVNTTAELAALSYSYAPVVIRLGVSAAGDASPLAFIRSNSACSLNAGAGDGGSQVPTSDGKCRLAVFPAKVDVSQFGVVPGTANNTQLQYAVNAAAASGYPLVFDKPTGLTDPSNASNCYQVTTAILLPSAAGGGTTWEFDNAFEMRGSRDSKYTTCIHTTGTIAQVAYFYQSGVGGTTGRLANASLTIAGLDFIGPQDWANGACALAIDNQRTPHIHDNSFFGYVGPVSSTINPNGGCGIFIYSYRVGGSYSGIVERNQFGLQHYTILDVPSPLPGYDVVYSFDDLRVWANRNSIILRGPYQSNGRANDWRFRDNRHECFTASAHVLEGSGTWTDSFGSSQNTKGEGNFYIAYCVHAMERGTLSAVTSADTMTLRTDAGTYLFSGTDFTSTPTGAPMVLRVSDSDGRYWAAPIESASGRQVTLSKITMLTGTLASGTSTTATLPSTGVLADSWYNTATLDVTGGTCSGSSGPVTAYVGATRVATVTLSPACTPDNTSVFTLKKPPLPFTPTTSSDYELGYADSLGAAKWPQNPLAYGHAWYFGQGWAFSATDEGSYYENAQIILAKGSSANCFLAQPQTPCDPPNSQNNFELINANPNVSRGWYAFYEDMSPFMPKGLALVDEIRIGGVAASRILKNAIVGDPEFFSNINPVMFQAFNRTGHALRPGDVVELDNNGGGSGKFNVIDATGGASKCFVVTMPSAGGLTEFPADSPVTLALKGFVRVYTYSPTSTAVSLGDIAVAQAPVSGKGSGSGAGTGLNVQQGSATVAQNIKKCGTYMQSLTAGATNAGVSDILLWVE